MTRAAACFLALGVLWAAHRARAQDAPMFRTRTDGIAVDVLVKRGRHPVDGLNAADFTVLDNGIPQPIKTVARAEVPLMVSLVLDVSASVRGDKLAALKRAAAAALRELAPVDRANLITFGNVVRLHTAPIDAPAAAARAIEALEGIGSTPLYDALHGALVLLDGTPPSHRPMVLVFSDGQDTTSVLTSRMVFETTSARPYGEAIPLTAAITRSSAGW